MRTVVVAALLAVTACSAPTTTAPVAAKLPDNAVSASVTIGTLHAKRMTRDDAKAELLYLGTMPNALVTLPVNMLMIDGAVTTSDALAAIDWLKKDSTLPIIVHGFGTTAGVALEAANTRQLPGVVLEGTLASEASTRIIGDYRGSILFVVGENDHTTPANISAKLLDDAGVSPWKRLVVTAGKKHGDAMSSDVALASYRELVSYVAH
jgi:hypothetical protein